MFVLTVLVLLLTRVYRIKSYEFVITELSVFVVMGDASTDQQITVYIISITFDLDFRLITLI